MILLNQPLRQRVSPCAGDPADVPRHRAHDISRPINHRTGTTKSGYSAGSIADNKASSLQSHSKMDVIMRRYATTSAPCELSRRYRSLPHLDVAATCSAVHGAVCFHHDNVPPSLEKKEGVGCERISNLIAQPRHHPQVRNSPWTMFFYGVDATKKPTAGPLGANNISQPVPPTSRGDGLFRVGSRASPSVFPRWRWRDERLAGSELEISAIDRRVSACFPPAPTLTSFPPAPTQNPSFVAYSRIRFRGTIGHLAYRPHGD